MLAQSVGVLINRHGEALCPFHPDTNKSLKIYSDPARGWHCFGCGKGGTVIDFAMLWYGITFKQAIIRLDADFGLGLPLNARAGPEARRKARREAEEQARRRETAKEAVSTAETTLQNVSWIYCEVLNTIEMERPKRPSGAISEAYAKALKMLPEIRYEFEIAQDALEQARKEVALIGSTSAAGRADQRMDA